MADLVAGLFLIFAPLFVVGWLSITIILHSRSEAEAAKQDEDLSELLSSIDGVNTDLREMLNDNGVLPEDKRQKFEALLERSESLRSHLAEREAK
jgi:hypothetical protein